LKRLRTPRTASRPTERSKLEKEGENLDFFVAWWVCLGLSARLGKEFLDCMWSIWDDEIDEPPSFPLLQATWPLWRRTELAYCWLWVKCWAPLAEWLERRLPRLFPAREPPEIPMDADGRTPDEWLAITVIGIWKLKDWYGDEYDWEVKRNWDEYQKSRMRRDDAQEISSGTDE
jgi:hypothetical protein